jgi:hypothetical protein
LDLVSSVLLLVALFKLGLMRGRSTMKISLLQELDLTAILASAGLLSWQMIDMIRPGGMKKDIADLNHFDELIKTIPQREIQASFEAIQKAKGIKQLLQAKKDIANNPYIPEGFRKELYNIIHTRLDQIPRSQLMDHFLDGIKNSTSMLVEHFHNFI